MNQNITEPVDGSVYAYQVSPHEGLVYVTIAGPDEDRPQIIAFDRDDLDHLKAARKELRAGIDALQDEPDPGLVLSILNGASSTAMRFVFDRVEYRYDIDNGEWVAQRRVDIEDDDVPVCGCPSAFCSEFHATTDTDNYRMDW